MSVSKVIFAFVHTCIFYIVVVEVVVLVVSFISDIIQQ